MTISNILLEKLHDKSLAETSGFINGKRINEAKSGNRFDVFSPATGERIATLPDLGSYETRLAIESAYIAQKKWAENTGSERADILRNLNDLILENLNDLAIILTAEMGKPILEAENEIKYGASYIEWFSEEAKRIYGDVIPSQQKDSRILVLKQPIGVVGTITPWNFPNAMIARKIAPALAVGCAVVSKPSEYTPLSANALAILAERAGLPAGLFNVIPSTRGAEVGLEMCHNQKLRKLSFTGSTEVGRILLKQSADQIKKLSLELGGNAPFIVFADADLDAAVDGLIISKFRNAGQTCVCTNRIYVQAPVYEIFTQKLAEKVKPLKVGNGFEKDTSIGPIINENSIKKIEIHVADALEKGADLISGGQRSSVASLFYEPTILKNATKEMKIAQEETFGPVAALFKFETTEDVIQQANDTQFGLASYFYARDLNKVWQVAEALEYGMVGINTGLISTPAAPFGGIKQSGLGREGSKYGADDYLELKYLCFGAVG